MLINKQEAAQMCGVSASSFERHIRKDLACVQVGHSVRFDKEQVEAWIEKKKETPGVSSDTEAGSSTHVSPPTVATTTYPQASERVRLSPAALRLLSKPMREPAPSIKKPSQEDYERMYPAVLGAQGR